MSLLISPTERCSAFSRRDSRTRGTRAQPGALARCLARLLCVAAIAGALWAPWAPAGTPFSGAHGLAAGLVGVLTLLVVQQSPDHLAAARGWLDASLGWTVLGGVRGVLGAAPTDAPRPAVNPATATMRARALGMPALLFAGTLGAIALTGGWAGPLAPLTLLPALLLDAPLSGAAVLLLAGAISVVGTLLMLVAAPTAPTTFGSTSRVYVAVVWPAAWAMFAAATMWLRSLLAGHQPVRPAMLWHELGRPHSSRSHALARASHELLTPLAAIQAGAGLLAEPSGLLGGSGAAVVGAVGAATPPISGGVPDLTVARRVADNVWRNAARLSLLLEDVLELARWHEAPPRLDPAWHACAAVLQRATDALSLLCESRSQRVVWTATPPDLLFWGDARRIEQVLVNLLSNAHKYAGERACITVVARPWAGGVQWEVCDDGPGLDDRSQARVFSPDCPMAERPPDLPSQPGSFRNHAADAASHGLGLAVVSALIALHGGSLWAEPAVGGGCRMVIWLPGHRGGPECALRSAPAAAGPRTGAERDEWGEEAKI